MAISATVYPKLSCNLFPKQSLSLSFPHPSALHLAKSKLSSSLSFGQKPKPFTIHTQGLSPRSSSFITHAIDYPSPSTTLTSSSASNSTTFHGLCYIVGDKIARFPMIPAEHISESDDFEMLGLYARAGLLSSHLPIQFIEPGQKKSKFSILIAGSNFGCGLSRQLDPAGLEVSGVAAVVAESFSSAFLRNPMSTRRIHLLESKGRICDECETGHVVTVEVGESRLINHSTGKVYKLKLIGDYARPVVVETVGGGNLACGRQDGKMMMIPSHHWAHIIVGTVCSLVMVTTLLLVGRAQGNITISIMNDQRQSHPKITSMENHNNFGVSVCNVKDNVDK